MKKGNILANKMHSNTPSYGIFMTLYDPGVASILADSGFDWIFVDAEHSPFSDRDIEALVNILRDRETVPVIRIREARAGEIKFALDCGAGGVIVPQLRTLEDFKNIVAWGKYPPLGRRGYSPLRATDFWTDKDIYDARANVDTLVIGQVECPEAVEIIDDIVCLEGLDGIFIGPSDLSWEMGKRGDMSHPDVQAAVSMVIAAAERQGLPWGIPCANADDLKLRVSQGGLILTISSDSRLIKSGATAITCNINN